MKIRRVKKYLWVRYSCRTAAYSDEVGGCLPFTSVGVTIYVVSTDRWVSYMRAAHFSTITEFRHGMQDISIHIPPPEKIRPSPSIPFCYPRNTPEGILLRDSICLRHRVLHILRWTEAGSGKSRWFASEKMTISSSRPLSGHYRLLLLLC